MLKMNECPTCGVLSANKIYCSAVCWSTATIKKNHKQREEWREMKRMGMTNEEIARKVGKSVSTISNSGRPS